MHERNLWLELAEDSMSKKFGLHRRREIVTAKFFFIGSFRTKLKILHCTRGKINYREMVQVQ